MDPNNNKQEENINVDRTNVERKEQPSLVGATFIKYASYIIILVIVLYFIVKYVFPKI